VLAVVLVVLVVVVGGFLALYFSDLFAITRVEVAGNEKLQSSYVLGLAAVPEDSTLLRTDVQGITGRLVAEPWVEQVELERVFPDTLILHITEQPVAAVVDIVPETANDTTKQWIITENGTWISEVNSTSNEGVQIDAEDFVALPKIRDVSAAVRPESGAVESDEGVTNALALLRGFSPEMREMVASISAPDAVKTTLTLYNNVGVAFGAAEDIEAKEQAIATLLAEHEGKITYINVRVANRATYRAAE
jgi:cell division protein FtsQ